jgi:hypothetical protein
MEVCSKTKCKKIFLLTDNDIKNVKFIYLENNPTQQFYKFSDIKKVVLDKYGSFDNLQNIINQKNKYKESKHIKTKNIIAERETELKQLFELNKLEFKNYGDIYSYINYGKPALETVLENELSKLNNKNNRRIILANKLKTLNIRVDESLKSCYEFVNGLATKSLDEIVRCIEVESFLKNETNYIELCNKYSSELAKDIAIRQYASTHKLPKNIKKTYSNTISFDN